MKLGIYLGTGVTQLVTMHVFDDLGALEKSVPDELAALEGLVSV